MDIKDQWQVCSLELSKRLKALGYPQESLWYWVKHFECRTDRFQWDLFLRDDDDDVNECIFAPTAAEIGMALPLTTWFNHSERGFEVHDVNAKKDFVADTEAEARGLMWEYLKKNGLLKEKEK